MNITVGDRDEVFAVKAVCDCNIKHSNDVLFHFLFFPPLFVSNRMKIQKRRLLNFSGSLDFHWKMLMIWWKQLWQLAEVES